MPDFPERPHHQVSSREPLLLFGLILALIATALIMLLFRLGVRDVCSGNEAVEAVFVQQMVEQHRYLFPVENGITPMYKPPLFHWTATAIDRLAKVIQVTAFNVRLASVLYAILGILLVTFFAYDLLGLEGALLAGLAMLASYEYIAQGRFARVDMTLTFYETLALFSFWWWIGAAPAHASNGETQRPLASYSWMQYMCAIALGLAILAKGPVGAILPLLATILFLVTEKRARQVAINVSPIAIAIALIVGSSWYAACYFEGRSAFLHRQLGSENVGRFLGSLGAMSPLYYLIPILTNSMPFSLLVPVAVLAALGPSQIRRTAGIGDDAPASQASRLLAIFWIVSLVFFSVAAYKRRAYLLPLWPASAVLLSWFAVKIARKFGGRTFVYAVAATAIVMIAINFVYIPHREAHECAGDSFRPFAAEVTKVVASDEPLYTYGFDEELAPLLFYLDRDAPQLSGKLGDTPPGYIILPANIWAKKRGEALDLEPVLDSAHGTRHLILLHRGKVYASGGEKVR